MEGWDQPHSLHRTLLLPGLSKEKNMVKWDEELKSNLFLHGEKRWLYVNKHI